MVLLVRCGGDRRVCQAVRVISIWRRLKESRDGSMGLYVSAWELAEMMKHGSIQDEVDEQVRLEEEENHEHEQV